jgi:chromosome partitioning protein
MAETVLFSFGNQKGGVGKSTLTSVIANYIKSRTDYSIAVVDADEKQGTISRWRERDKAEGLIGDNNYELEKIDSAKFPKAYTEMVYGEFDFVVVDLPGTLMQEGVVQCYTLVDVLFCPFNVVTADVDATNVFLENYLEKVVALRKHLGYETKIYGVISKIDKRTSEYKKIKDVRAEFVKHFPIPLLQSVFPYAPSFFGRNANTAIDYSRENKEMEQFCKEVFDILLASIKVKS